MLPVAGQAGKQDEGHMCGRNCTQTLWREDGCKYLSCFLTCKVMNWSWCIVA